MASSKVSSPWGKTETVVPCSLEDVMSEQLASQLHDKESHEEQPASQQTEAAEESKAAAAALGSDLSDAELAQILAAAAAGVDAEETDSDEMIARMMQLQYDREHNSMLEKEQRQYNGTSKVSISFEKYKTSHPQYEEEEEEEEEEIYDWPQKTKWEEGRPVIGSKGYVGSGKNITTKHDKVICGRKNAERLMTFPPSFESGDGEGMDMQLPNKVFNKLKKFSMAEDSRGARNSEKKDHSTAEHVVDKNTRVLLFKLVNTGFLESIGGVIAAGKESLVYQARMGSMTENMGLPEDVPTNVALKIFKTTLMEFKTREKYVHGDHRFASDDFKKQNPRKIIKIWAMKEVANLNRMRKFGVPCPSVVALKKHILIMSMIGDETGPAPKLRYCPLSYEQLQDAYEQTLEIMKTIYQQCGLVHADLSEYNLLWHDDKVYVIDVSQAVDVTHPQALAFLLRDCTNICDYFQKQGVYGVPSPEKLFNEVTGLDIPGEGADFSVEVGRYDKHKKEKHILLDQQYSKFGFDYFYEKMMQEKEEAAKKSLGEEYSDEEGESSGEGDGEDGHQ